MNYNPFLENNMLADYQLAELYRNSFTAGRLTDGRWFIVNKFGEEQNLTAQDLAAILPQACEWAGEDLEEEKTWFNSLRPEGYRDGHHPQGKILDQRSRVQESVGFLGVGAGSRRIREVLVRLDAEWEDTTADFLTVHPAGSEVWLVNPYPDEWPTI